MKTMEIAGIDHPLSTQVLGTLTFGDTVDKEGARQMISIAREAGINMIDTANGYADGNSERLLGDLRREFGDSMVVCTKAGIPHPDAENHPPLSPRGLRASLEGSLARLSRDSVDVFYLHRPDRETPIMKTVQTLRDLQTEGKIRTWGISNYSAWQIADLHRAAEQVGIAHPAVAQQLYNPIARRLEDEYAEFATSRNFHTMAYNLLAGGILSGKYDFSRGPGSSGRFSSSMVADRYRNRFWNEHLFAGVSALNRIAEESGLTLIELALRWVISQKVTTSVLVGASRPEHLQTNLRALSRGPLEPNLVAACQEATAYLRGPMPAYNR